MRLSCHIYAISASREVHPYRRFPTRAGRPAKVAVAEYALPRPVPRWGLPEADEHAGKSPSGRWSVTADRTRQSHTSESGSVFAPHTG